MKSNPDHLRPRRHGQAFAIAAVLLLLVLFVDAPVDRWVATHRSAAWEGAAKLCSRFLAWHWLMFAAALALLFAWMRGRRDLLRLICVMMISASLAGLSADLLRGITGRTRPYAPVPQGFYGVHDGSRWLITEHAFNSFPSGHTAAITGLLAPLAMWRRRFLWAVVPLVGLVAAARVYLGAHHLSDILAGALLGAVIGVLVWQRAFNAQRVRA